MKKTTKIIALLLCAVLLVTAFWPTPKKKDPENMG